MVLLEVEKIEYQYENDEWIHHLFGQEGTHSVLFWVSPIQAGDPGASRLRAETVDGVVDEVEIQVSEVNELVVIDGDRAVSYQGLKLQLLSYDGQDPDVMGMSSERVLAIHLNTLSTTDFSVVNGLDLTVGDQTFFLPIHYIP